MPRQVWVKAGRSSRLPEGDSGISLSWTKRRHHIVRQALAERAFQLARIKHHVRRDRNDITDQTVLAQYHRRLGNRGFGRKRRLDLAKFDTEAAQFHLRIGTADEVEQAIFNLARSPVRYIDCRRTVRVGNKTFGRQAGTVEIAARQPNAGNIKIADDPLRNWSQPSIENEDLRPVDRPADRRRPGPLHRVHQRPDGGLGRTVQINHLGADGEQLDGKGLRQRLAPVRIRMDRNASASTPVNVFHKEGVACMMVVPLTAISRASAGGCCRNARGARENHPGAGQ